MEVRRPTSVGTGPVRRFSWSHSSSTSPATEQNPATPYQLFVHGSPFIQLGFVVQLLLPPVASPWSKFSPSELGLGEPLTLELRAGDVVLMDYRCFHRGGANTSEDLRCVLYATFASEGDHHSYSLESQAQTLVRRGGVSWWPADATRSTFSVSQSTSHK